MSSPEQRAEARRHGVAAVESPQDNVAEDFMRGKGYRWVQPRDVTKLEGSPCWYYVYDLPDGVLELEVSWDGAEWQTLVTAYQGLR